MYYSSSYSSSRMEQNLLSSSMAVSASIGLYHTTFLNNTYLESDDEDEEIIHLLLKKLKNRLRKTRRVPSRTRLFVENTVLNW